MTNLLQAKYEAERRAATEGKHAVTRPLRHIGGDTMQNPPLITYRADMEADVRERLHAGGFEFADEPPGPGAFFG